MAQLMLVNPRKRRAKKTAAPKRKTRARRARRSNPVGRARAAHARPVRRHRRRRNPVSGGHGIAAQLKNAFSGAVGGLAVDILAGFITPKLPVSMQGGYMGKVVKVGLAVAFGMVAKKSGLVKGPMAARMVEGAMTVELYDLTRNVFASAMPNVRLAGNDGMGEFIPMSEYIPVGGEDSFAGATADRLLAGGDDYLAGDYMDGIADDFAGMEDGAMAALYPNPYDM